MANGTSRLSLLWKKFLSDELTREEWDELNEMLDSTEGGKQFFAENSDETKLLSHLSYMRNMDDARIRLKIEKARRASTAPPRLWKYGVAAATIGMIFMAGYLFYKQKPISTSFVAAKAAGPAEIAPGGTRATLTLGNGSNILLEKAANGQLAEQGGSVVEKSGGSLKYQMITTGNSEVLYNTLTTPRAGIFDVVLPDGTHVWLNNVSSLRYPTAFSGHTREVELKGEAFFEVAKDPTKPFYVRTGKSKVEILGTSFNIAAYNDEGEERTTLLEGKVRVATSETNEPAKILQPGEQTIISASGVGKIAVAHDIDVNEVVAWKNGYFHFSHTGMRAALRQLARWYDVDVDYQGNVSDQPISGKIERSLSLSAILQGLETDKIHFNIESKKIIVVSP